MLSQALTWLCEPPQARHSSISDNEESTVQTEHNWTESAIGPFDSRYTLELSIRRT
jgi:hypothetical protein